jgi:hypothetical protein
MTEMWYNHNCEITLCYIPGLFITSCQGNPFCFMLSKLLNPPMYWLKVSSFHKIVQEKSKLTLCKVWLNPLRLHSGIGPQLHGHFSFGEILNMFYQPHILSLIFNNHILAWIGKLSSMVFLRLSWVHSFLIHIYVCMYTVYNFPLQINTLWTGDANLRYNCERWMMQNCLLTRAWILRT